VHPVGFEHLVCALSDLADPGAREFSIGAGAGSIRGFVVGYQGSVRAYVNSCPHAGVRLNFRPDEFFAPHRSLLLCTVHGAQFEPHTGVCVAGPCTGQALQAVDIEIRDDYVYVRSRSAA
jgi:nitrite reductase/ring-hydroxylating ferredoxin subunit